MNDDQRQAWATLQAIAAKYEWPLTGTDPRDQEIADLRDRLAAAEQVCRANQTLARRLTREAEEDRLTRAFRETQMMQALPHRRFAGGTRLDEMVIQVCAWLREARPDLWRDMYDPTAIANQPTLK